MRYASTKRLAWPLAKGWGSNLDRRSDSSSEPSSTRTALSTGFRRPHARPDEGSPVAAQQIEAAPLPAPIAGLVGRADELAQIRGLLERSRAVTLTGPGGSGKTRLAIEHARGSDGARWFVDLGPVSDRAAVFNDVSTAFGVTVRASGDDVSGVIALSPTGLLVLDTCEHVVEAAAEVVAALLHGCPGLHVLATSRRPLEVAGELVCRGSSPRAARFRPVRGPDRSSGESGGPALPRTGAGRAS